MATKAEAEVAGKAIGRKEKIPWSLGKKVRVAAAGTVLVTLITGGTYEVTNNYPNIPALHQTKEILVPPNTFSNKADRGTISDENTIALSSTEIKQKFPEQITEDQANYIATIPFPLQAPEGTKIEFNIKTLNLKNTQQYNIDENAIIRSPELISPKGTEVRAPIDGHLYLIKDGEKLQSIALIKYNPELDRTYRISIGALNWPNPYSFDLDNSLLNLNFTGSIDSWEDFPTVKENTLLMTTNQDSVPLGMFTEVFKGKDLSAKALITERKSLPLSTNFYTTTDNNNIEKLVVKENVK